MATASLDLINRIPLFASLEQRELRELAEAMKERVFAAGRPVVTQGDTGVGFFVIESGTAGVEVGGQKVGILGPGDHFGEIALIADIPRTATVTAETDLVCWGMTTWEFRPLVEANAKIAWALLQGLARLLAARSAV